MNKDPWTDTPTNSDLSKGNRFNAQPPVVHAEETKTFKKTAAALKDDVRDVARSASETAKDVSKDVKAGAEDMGRTAADVVGTMKDGAQDAGAELKKGARGALQHTKEAASELGASAKDVAGVAKEAAIDAGAAAKEAIAVVKDDANELVQAAASSTKDMAREVGPAMRRATRATGAFVAGNAVPLSLLGFGAGWMLMKGRRRATWSEERAPRSSAKPAFSEPGESMGGDIRQAREAVAEEIGEARGKTRAFVHTVGERAQEVAHETRERASHLKDQTVHQLESARDAVGRQATKVGKQARTQYVHGKQVTTDFAQHNPLLLIALSLGAGMGTSYLLPSTRTEQRLMAGPRDRLVGEARQTVTRIGEIAHQAAHDARQPS